MKEYRVEQEVHYLHKETGFFMSRTELINLRNKGETNTIINKLVPPINPFAPDFDVFKQTWKYRIEDIPFSDDWETIVMQPHTLNKRDIYAILEVLDTSIIQGNLQRNARTKLIKELEKIDERRYRFNVEIPTY